MNKFWLTAWLALPIAGYAWHTGPGQFYHAADEAADFAADGEQDADRLDWRAAEAHFTAALEALPAEAVEPRMQLQLARATARIRGGQLAEGQEDLARLLADLEKQPDAPESLRNATRYESAWASYYAAWQMRLEGAVADEWKPEADRARQQFRLLTEAASDDTERVALAKNLEATIRLEQMDLATLLARPLPKNCPPCDNLCKRKRKQQQSMCQSRSGQQGPKPAPPDARQDIKKQRGAGLNLREEGGS